MTQIWIQLDVENVDEEDLEILKNIIATNLDDMTPASYGVALYTSAEEFGGCRDLLAGVPIGLIEEKLGAAV